MIGRRIYAFCLAPADILILRLLQRFQLSRAALQRAQSVVTVVVTVVVTISVGDPANLQACPLPLPRDNRPSGGFLRLSEEHPVTDPLAYRLLILLGSLTPGGALGNHGLDEAAE
jgi:hypothetical protein